MANITPTVGTLPAWEARNNFAPAAPNGRWGMFYDSYNFEEMETNWDKSFPFQLLILNEVESGNFEVVTTDGGALKFTLPIPPDAMTISMPFAIDGAVSLGGYIENHGGAPVKTISFSGTTGVLPTRGAADTAQTPSLGQAIFAGSLQAARRLGAAISTISGTSKSNPNVYEKDRFGDDPSFMLSKSTGYYQFLLLQRFLEAYAEMKKQRINRTYRLALAIWKDEAIYITRPVVFTLKRTADSPLERRYDLQLEAFARISPKSLGLGSQQASKLVTVSGRDPNALAHILNSVRGVRASLQAGSALIRALGADIENVVFGSLREVTFMSKDALGVPLTMLDLPHALVRDFKTSVISQFNEVYATTLRLRTQAEQQSAQFLDDFNLLEDAAQVHQTKSINFTAHPAHSIFDEPQDHPEILDALDVGLLILPDAHQQNLDAERVRVRSLTRRDYEQRRDALIKVASDYADAVGAGSATYNSVYGRNTAQIARRQPTDADFDVLFQLNQAAIEVSRLAAYANLTTPAVTPIEVIAGLAAQSGIDFRPPRSKFAVPFLYGHTLEGMASIYLKDVNRWIEIAALNGLREPYVDEDGFTLALLVNAHGNTVIVADGRELYIGQPVWLESTTSPRQKRHVIAVTKIATNLYSVVLDGDPVDQFTLAAASLLRAFLPHTVNSQMLIFIPSDGPAADDPRVKPIPGVDDFDHLLTVGGIDLLLTPKNDLVITPDGDGRWSYGFTNVIQQARIILNTPAGSLKRHRGFGMAVQIGDTSVTAKDILKAAREAFTQDPTYTGVKSAKVTRTGPTAQLVLSVGISGTTQNIPIAVDLGSQ